MPVKVSVIVPVYNPGPYVEDLISSLLRQSLPASEFEAIFVDDGSTDETPARLDALAAEHPHLRVIHQEASGWSGKPRNVGIGAAQGEYVFFSDNDDWLGDQALERMYDFAVKNGSDIVIGKMAGVNRGVPRELFRRTYDNATLDNAPLIDSLTPHKMFRRAFLDEHGLRFPEGRRRLEDHVFVTAAFFAAKKISVLSDYVCYYHISREDASNAGFQSIDPKGYFSNLSEALDIVRDNTEPGELRDKLYRRWLRVEMVERLRGARLLRMPAAERQPLFDEIRRVMQEYFGPGVAAGLPAIQQLVAALVRAGQLDELLKLAAWEAGIAGRARLDDLAWRAGTLELAFTAGLVADGEPMRFVSRDGRELFVPPLDAAVLDGMPPETLDVTKRLQGSRVDLLVKERTSHAEYFLPVKFQLDKQPLADGEPGDEASDAGFQAALAATVRLDPSTAAGGEPLADGLWDAIVRVTCCGWTKDTRIGSLRSEHVPDQAVPALVGSPPRLVTPYWTDKHNNLSLDISQQIRRLDQNVLPATPTATASHDGEEVVVTVPLTLARATTADPVAGLRLSRSVSGQHLETSGELTETGDLTADLTGRFARSDLTAGSWDLEVRVCDPGRYVKLPLRLSVPANGAPSVERVAQKKASRLDERISDPLAAKPSLTSRLRRLARRYLARG